MSRSKPLVLAAVLASSVAFSCSRSHTPVADAGANDDVAFQARLDGAIRSATNYFAGRAATLDPRLAMVLAYPQRKFAPPGLPPMVPRALDKSAGPDELRFALLFRRLVDADATADAATIDSQATEIDRTTATALYCDRLGKPELLPRLMSLSEERDEYSLPHAMMATGWAKENGCIGEDAFRLLRSRQIDRVEARMNAHPTGPLDDSLVECVVFLYYLGARSEVKRAWVHRVLDAQLPSGGWASQHQKAEDHISALSYWLLLEAAHPNASKVGWIPR